MAEAIHSDVAVPPASPDATPDADAETLRGELKAWEKAFAQTHEGKKPGRADIKAEPIIALKYKIYNRVTGRLPPAPVSQPLSTPKANRKRNFVDCEKENAHPSPRKSPRSGAYASPRSCLDTPTAQRTCIGPTPQKNGQVLGLFDQLSPASLRRTPSKPRAPAPDGTPSSRRHLPGPQGLTPAKSRTHSSLPPSDAAPASPLAPFRTPSAARVGPAATPGSRDTPAVLRRDAVSLFARPTTQDGGSEELSWSPVPVRRLRPQPAGRALSQILKGLRDMEEEQLDDELEALREMEAEESGVALPAPKKREAKEVEWPLGPDGEALDAEGGREEGAEEKRRRSWKKKGQKRTTRPSNIGVSEKRWEPEPEWNPGEKADKKEGGRKVSATAHANYRALKIKNKNSKSKRGGRFGHR